MLDIRAHFFLLFVHVFDLSVQFEQRDDLLLYLLKLSVESAQLNLVLPRGLVLLVDLVKDALHCLGDQRANVVHLHELVL